MRICSLSAGQLGGTLITWLREQIGHSGVAVVVQPDQLRKYLGIGRLFELVPDAIIVGDPGTGRVALWNQAAETVFGYTAAEAIGMPLEQLVPAELRALHLAGIHNFAQVGRGALVDSQQLVELPAIHQSGKQIWVELRLAAVGDSLPMRYVVAVLRDVTERRAAQDAAAASAAKAEKAETAMRDLLAMVSHDLRAPVTALKAATSMLDQHSDRLAPEQSVELLAIAGRQTDHMTALLDNLLDLLTADSDAYAARPELIVVTEAINDAVETAAVSGVVVNADPLTQVLVDGTHLRRVLVNLLHNAGKYGAPPITVTSEPGTDGVFIHVDDCGPGVAEDFEHRLFDRFARPANPSISGHGLGLNIAKTLMVANFGDLSYSRLPTGSRFTLRVPDGSSAGS